MNIGTVSTGAAGSSATVVNSGTPNAAVLDFSIPVGATGATGAAGSDSVENSNQQDDLATGWWTFAYVKGRDGGFAQRAMATFYVRETDSSRHRSVQLMAGHHYGRDGSNFINIQAATAYGNGISFDAFRIKEGDIYDGAVLQVQITNSTNRLHAHMMHNLQEGMVDAPSRLQTPMPLDAALTLGYSPQVEHGLRHQHGDTG